MPIIGTAGHVDHGKSTLVERLTGRDPDRWSEEKERGLTIDLGFAWATLPSGTVASFVDVPGHERYMKNALAGVDGFDAVLLVVAADEGWSAQTTEHVAALDALGISRGVVAVTKADLVDDDLAELAVLDTLERLDGTSIAGLEAVVVSAATGRGIDALVSALDAAISETARPTGGPARLWVDRVFSVTGSGTVVTGSLTAGTLATGDEVEVMPGGLGASVRGLHRHDAPVDSADAGTRLAINLAGIDRARLDRGMLVATPGTAWDAERLLVAVRPVANRSWERGAFHLHTGTAAVRVDLRPIDESHALVVADHPVPGVVGDRVLLRDVGSRSVVAGGIVLDPAPARRRSAAARSVGRLDPSGDSPDARAEALLDVRGTADAADLRRWSGGGEASGAISRDLSADLIGRLRALVEDHHDRYPLRPGFPKAEAASSLGVTVDVVDSLLGDAGVVERGPALARPDHDPTLTSRQAADWAAVEERLVAAGNAPERLDAVDLDREVVHHVLRSGALVDVGGFAYPSATLAALVAGMGDLQEPWTVADFRDHAGISRKHAVPLLEWLDAEGITRRTGDTRGLRRPSS